MPNTTTWTITYPDSTSNLTPLESHFQTLATTADTALSTLKSNIRGTDSSSTIASLASSITTTNTRLALNLQTSAGTPTGAPSNSGIEGSLNWDSINNILYIYNEGAWKPIHGDIGWANITMTGGTPNFIAGSPVPQYKVVNGIAYIKGMVQPTGTTVAGTTYSVGTIPAGARPSNAVGVAIASNSFATTGTPDSLLKPGRLLIATDGSMSIVSAFGSTDAPNYYLNTSYPIA
jgi:hypothetical protein